MTSDLASLADLSALSRSVHDGSLELLYQPEVELDSGAIAAMEGLLRWRHGDLGVLAPPAFLELAERSGDIGPIGDWVLRTGAAEAKVWAGLPGPTRRLWLNAGFSQVTSPAFVEAVAHVLARFELPADALGLEVSESTVLRLGADAAPLLGDLRGAGVALALDDLSSWYATLGAIAELPLDVVKLGVRHVRGLDDGVDPGFRTDAVVGRLVESAHDSGMTVVAESVQTWTEAARLTDLGCDRAHGWLFASPQRADRARWLLSRGQGWMGSTVSPQTRGSLPVELPRPRPEAA